MKFPRKDDREATLKNLATLPPEGETYVIVVRVEECRSSRTACPQFQIYPSIG